MTTKERIELINNAIDNVLFNLQNGIEIKEYTIDNLKIVKRSPLGLINELKKIRQQIISEGKGTARQTHKAYIFGDRY